MQKKNFEKNLMRNENSNSDNFQHFQVYKIKSHHIIMKQMELPMK